MSHIRICCALHGGVVKADSLVAVVGMHSHFPEKFVSDSERSREIAILVMRVGAFNQHTILMTTFCKNNRCKSAKKIKEFETVTG